VIAANSCTAAVFNEKEHNNIEFQKSRRHLRINEPFTSIIFLAQKQLETMGTIIGLISGW
jgi:hypothetical protein